jgi:hypothetical protein
MRESTDRIELALHGDNHREQLIARRILETPRNWQQWESEHSGLMHEVADFGASRAQSISLKRAAMRLIHSKALFEYLRDKAIRGEVRHRIIKHFHPTHSYSRALVMEHGIYLRKAGSFICTTHVGSALIQDSGFLDPMRRYETLYAEYFDLFCRSYFGDEAINAESGSETETPAQTALLPLLKYQLRECREAILDPKHHLNRFNRDGEIHMPVGDTQRVKVLDPKA